MLSILSVIALGFFLGMRHATDADHVVAVMTIVSRQRSLRPAAWVGALWGVGHTITIVLVGGAIILFNWVVSPRVGLTMELAVGVMLVALGVLNMTGTIQAAGVMADPEHPGEHPAVVHAHAHAHAEYVHTHVHAHDPERHPHAADATPVARLDRWFTQMRGYQTVRPLLIGLVHGLAGSAAVALLVLSTIRDTTWAVAYLLVFGIGTIAGMMLITTIIAMPFAYTSRQFATTNRRLQIATGMLSLAFGLFVAYQIGIVEGLFTGDMHWTPK